MGVYLLDVNMYVSLSQCLLAFAWQNSSIRHKYFDFGSAVSIMISLQGNFLVSIHLQNWQGCNENKCYL
jgi:hypothetical protein